MTALTSCNNSPIDKANTLIKEECLKNLLKADSYDPVETKIDSAFTPYDSPTFHEKVMELAKLNQAIQEYDEKAKQAKSSMTIWEHPYDAYSRNQYQEDKEEYEEYTEKRNLAEKRVQKIANGIKDMMQKEPEFIGFKAIHRFRANNNAGQTLMGNTYYLFDKDLSQIIVSYDMDSEDFLMIQQIIQQIIDEKEESIDSDLNS